LILTDKEEPDASVGLEELEHDVEVGHELDSHLPLGHFAVLL